MARFLSRFPLKPLDICRVLYVHCGFGNASRSALTDTPFFAPLPYRLARLGGSPNPRRTLSASNAGRADGNVVVPEGVGVPAIRLPAKVDGSGLRLDAAPLPLGGIRVAHTRLRCQPSDNVAVQPRLDRAISSEVILEALPAASREGRRGGDALRGEVGERGIIGLAVVHQNLALPTDAEVLLGSLGGVGHGDEGYVRVGQGLRCLSRRW